MNYLALNILLIFFSNNCFAQNYQYYAGSVHKKGTEVSIGLVCKDSTNTNNCETLDVVRAFGQTKAIIGEASASKLASHLDAAIQDFLLLFKMKKKDAETFQKAIGQLVSQNSNQFELESPQYNNLLEFMFIFKDLFNLKDPSAFNFNFNEYANEENRKIKFYLLKEASDQTDLVRKLYLCSYLHGFYVSLASNCEHYGKVSVMGYIFVRQFFGSIPLYRYVDSVGNHLYTTNATPGGNYSLESLIGYVLP